MLSVSPPSPHIFRNFPCVLAHFQLPRSKTLCLNAFYQTYKRPLDPYSPGPKCWQIKTITILTQQHSTTDDSPELVEILKFP